MENIKTPWLEHYGDVPFYLDYTDKSMVDKIFETASKYPDNIALSFMGKHITYSHMCKSINVVARSFAAIGIKEGDVVTLCMPNTLQTVYCLYALNKLGALASMVHPLSAVGELVFYLKKTASKCVVTLDGFYKKLEEVKEQVAIDSLVITSIADALPSVKSVAYRISQIGKLPKIPKGNGVIMWKDFIKGGFDYLGESSVIKRGEDAAVILFSGGTTGKTKGILLSNRNFNALALQTETMCHCNVTGKTMIAAMPMFHGFGLGVCVHTMLCAGGRSLLVPRVNVKEYAKMLAKERPNFIAGVPTLFEAITRNPYLENVNLDCLMGVFSGGDSLSVELKKKIDAFLESHGAKVHVREGYGTTECVTASCLTPYHTEKEGSIGLPYPDTYYKICKPGSEEELPYGEHGEICLCGPTVMMGYLNDPEETSNTLKTHADGRVWLHTGDLGYMDSEGYIYFKQRIKRMIITSGYNVYPSQIENILDSHPAVQMSCVIGVKDPYKMQKVKAFAVLKDGFEPNEAIMGELIELCKKNIAKYALPYAIEFRKSLPKTLVGKIAYTELEKEENAKEEAKRAQAEAAKERV